MKNKVINTHRIIMMIITSSVALCAGMQEGGRQDPLRSLDYRAAFNQTKLYQQHRELMELWECTSNVTTQSSLSTERGSALNAVSHNIRESHEPEGNDETDQLLINIQPDQKSRLEQERAYRNACLAQLTAARRWAVLRPSHESGIMMALLFGSSALSSQLLGNDSVGTGVNTGLVLINFAYLFRDFVRSGYDWTFLPEDALQKLEEYYAVNKCFIPQEIWGAIEQQFMMGRANEFEQRKAVSFLEFALALTVYKPRADFAYPKPVRIMNTLTEKIDAFFDAYDKPSDKYAITFIKANVFKFLNALKEKNTEHCPRYLYLHGPGGIGKTYFVQELHKWLNDLLGERIDYSAPVVSSPAELEGNAEKPGAFLTILRNCLQHEKDGSIVFIDEANWLNEGPMNAAAKRVFDGNKQELATSYFGSNLEGRELKLRKPDMLCILAGNNKIEDEALKRRFDVVTFPMPLKKALISYAFRKAHARARDAHLTKKAVGEWLEKEQIKSFGAIDSRLDPFLMTRP